MTQLTISSKLKAQKMSKLKRIQAGVMYDRILTNVLEVGAPHTKFTSLHNAIVDFVEQYKDPRQIDVALKNFSDRELSFLTSPYWFRKNIVNLQIVAASNGGMVVSKRGKDGGYRRTVDKKSLGKFAQSRRQEAKNKADTTDYIIQVLNNNPHYQLGFDLFKLPDADPPEWFAAIGAGEDSEGDS